MAYPNPRYKEVYYKGTALHFVCMKDCHGFLPLFLILISDLYKQYKQEKIGVKMVQNILSVKSACKN